MIFRKVYKTPAVSYEKYLLIALNKIAKMENIKLSSKQKSIQIKAYRKIHVKNSYKSLQKNKSIFYFQVIVKESKFLVNINFIALTFQV